MILKDIFSKKVDSIQLAYELFNFNKNGNYAKEVKKIIKEYTKKGEQYPDRQDIFLKSIDLIGEPKNSKERYIVAKAYLYSRFPFKLKGIEYGNSYLNNELWEEEFLRTAVPFNIKESIETKKNIHIANILNDISLIYESEYRFEEALNNYNKIIKLVPFFSNGYISTAKVLVKMGKCEDALSILKDARNSKYYKPYYTKKYEWQIEQLNDEFKSSIERSIDEIQEKIDKSYKYIPRSSKCTLTKEYYENLSELQKKYIKEFIEKQVVEIK